jgi:protein SCO1/2
MRPAPLVLVLAACLAPAFARALPRGPGEAEMTVASASAASGVLRQARVEERLHTQVPLDAAFTDAAGARVTLGALLATGRPTVLNLVYYECPSLCSLVLDGLVRALREVRPQLGADYQVVTVSIDPRDTPTASARRRRHQLRALGQPEEAPWHFLTGEEAEVQRLARAVGFHYAYDAASGQYAHPAVLMVLTAQGRVSRYLYGVQFPSRDVGLALLEAGEGRVGTTLERVVLSCYQFEPGAQRYGFSLLGFLRVMGAVTVGTLATLFALSRRKDLRDATGRAGAAGPPRA